MCMAYACLHIGMKGQEGWSNNVIGSCAVIGCSTTSLGCLLWLFAAVWPTSSVFLAIHEAGCRLLDWPRPREVSQRPRHGRRLQLVARH